MNKWIKWLLLLFQIGGGAFGLALVAKQLLSTEQTGISLILHIVFTLVFLFGIAAGVALVKKPNLGLLMSLVYQGIQIPIIISPVVAYRMFSGATFFVYGGQTGFGAYLFFGGHYLFWLNGSEPWLVGINFIALALFIFLFRERMFEEAPIEVDEPDLSTLGERPAYRIC